MNYELLVEFEPLRGSELFVVFDPLPIGYQVLLFIELLV